MKLKKWQSVCYSYISYKPFNIHLFLKYLLDVHYVLGTSLDTVGGKQWTKQKEKLYPTGGEIEKISKNIVSIGQ